MATPAHPSDASRRLGLAIVIAAMAAIAMLYGYTGQLFSVVLEEHGVIGSLIGLSGASQMAGVFLVLPFLPRLVRRRGRTRPRTSRLGGRAPLRRMRRPGPRRPRRAAPAFPGWAGRP